MSKAMRQMPGQAGRANVARGEALWDLASDKACGPPIEHTRTGSAKPMAGAGCLLEAALTQQKTGNGSRPRRPQSLWAPWALLHLLRQLLHARLQLGRCAGVVAQVGRRKQWPGTAAQQSLQTHAVLCTCSNACSWLSY